jgi:predicted aspartyl protease
LCAPAGGAIAACKLAKMAELPVTMAGLRPVIKAQINGRDANFIVDSGAFYSTLSPAGAAEYKLRLAPVPINLIVSGVGGGAADVSLTTVKVFTLAGFPLKNVEFLVAGPPFGGGAVGLLGQNILRAGDVDYDLAKGVIRLMRAEDCKGRLLAYWVGEGQAYSVMDIGGSTLQNPQTTGIAYLNGAKISVALDSGSPASLLSLKAARRAGVTPQTAGVTEAGLVRGLGGNMTRTWIAPFAIFKIGDEEIRNTRLRIGDIATPIDMLIGADFFLSHHLYVARSQQKLYFTYNGGAVFDLSASPKQNPP